MFKSKFCDKNSTTFILKQILTRATQVSLTVDKNEKMNTFYSFD